MKVNSSCVSTVEFAGCVTGSKDMEVWAEPYPSYKGAESPERQPANRKANKRDQAVGMMEKECQLSKLTTGRFSHLRAWCLSFRKWCELPIPKVEARGWLRNPHGDFM